MLVPALYLLILAGLSDYYDLEYKQKYSNGVVTHLTN